MLVHPIILDSRPGYLADAPETSLAQMPAGETSVLAALLAQAQPMATGTPGVLPAFEPGAGYGERLLAAAGRPLNIVRGLSDAVTFCEPTDWLLLIDAAQYAPGGLPFSELQQALREPRRVTHLLVLSDGSRTAQERVLLDEAGKVRRIERYYRGVTSLESHAVCCALVSGAAARGAPSAPFATLTDLRAMLAADRVPNHDLFIDRQVLDLSTEAGLLELCANNLSAATKPAPSVAAGCTIHPTARIVGRVVFQWDVQVEAHVTVLGPTLVAAGAQLRAGATVIQCVVGPDAVVAPESTVHHSVIADRGAAPVDRNGHAAASEQRAVDREPSARGPDGTEPSEGYQRVKCAVEAAIAIASLLVLSPFLLTVAVLVKLSSPGPVFYGDLREGKGGRVFRCWKFRSMRKDADKQQRALYKTNQVDGPQFKMPSDPRTTPIGAVLRKTNIDELPQLFNVALGQMSLIGPRPSPFRENQICVAWRRARLSVRPGITGLWQICRHNREAGDFHQWIHYDILYVRHMSAMLDVKILLATLATMGGRWSVPLSWIIPRSKLDHGDVLDVPTRTPILSLATAGPS